MAIRFGSTPVVTPTEQHRKELLARLPRRAVIPPLDPVASRPWDILEELAATASPALPIDAPSPKIKASRKAGPKKAIYIRLDPDIVEFFQKDGPGWQTRMNEALRKAIE